MQVRYRVMRRRAPGCPESHTLRLWLISDLEKLARKSEAFEVAAIYGEDFVALEDKEHVSGEHGNVYVILHKV